MAAVCDYVVEAILSKLPVQSLLRFSCVSKTWYSIISDPKFCKITMRPGVFMCENRRDFSTISVESLLSKDRATAPLTVLWETEEHDDLYISCLGSCNGLVCVERRNINKVDRSGFIICNPSTRKFKTLPRPRRYLKDDWWIYTWFGYDESIHDYKIVRLNFRDGHAPSAKAGLDVFTLKSNAWERREVEHIAVKRSRDDSSTGGVLCNNAVHWITDYRRQRCILVFDLVTGEVRLLEFSHARLTGSAWVGSLDGECLWLCDHVCDGDFMVSNLWMMKEYGVDSSWMKILSIRCAIRAYPLRMYPILLSKEGEETAVICYFEADGVSGPIVKLRVEEGEVKNEEILFGVPRNPFARNIILPMEESLVSIDSEDVFADRRLWD